MYSSLLLLLLLSLSISSFVWFFSVKKCRAADSFPDSFSLHPSLHAKLCIPLPSPAPPSPCSGSASGSSSVGFSLKIIKSRQIKIGPVAVALLLTAPSCARSDSSLPAYISPSLSLAQSHPPFFSGHVNNPIWVRFVFCHLAENMQNVKMHSHSNTFPGGYCFCWLVRIRILLA